MVIEGRDASLTLPLISVVVAVYNGGATIERLLLSVIGNDYKNIDLIVIDGGSTDCTLDVLRRYDAQITFWQSEKDEGIYDALNKGLAVCKHNSYVLVLGADDQLMNLSAIVDCASVERADLIVANVLQRNIVTEKFKTYFCRLPLSINSKNFLHFPMHHQGFMFQVLPHARRKFDTKLGIHADYEFMARALQSSRKPIYINEIMAEYSTGGASDYFAYKNMSSLFRVARSLQLSFFGILISSPGQLARMMLKLLVSKEVIDFLRKVR